MGPGKHGAVRGCPGDICLLSAALIYSVALLPWWITVCKSVVTLRKYEREGNAYRRCLQYEAAPVGCGMDDGLSWPQCLIQRVAGQSK